MPLSPASIYRFAKCTSQIHPITVHATSLMTVRPCRDTQSPWVKMDVRKSLVPPQYMQKSPRVYTRCRPSCIKLLLLELTDRLYPAAAASHGPNWLELKKKKQKNKSNESIGGIMRTAAVIAVMVYSTWNWLLAWCKICLFILKTLRLQDVVRTACAVPLPCFFMQQFFG